MLNIEFGSGPNPTPGFLSTDVNCSHKVDFCGEPWKLDIENDSVDTFLALGVMEHLEYDNFDKTLSFVNKKLKKGGSFFFDVPDITIWARYLVDFYDNKDVPFEEDHIWATLYGWQRWKGDEHKSGWSKRKILEQVNKYSWTLVSEGVDLFLSSGFERRRMGRPHDAHIYLKLVK